MLEHVLCIALAVAVVSALLMHVHALLWHKGCFATAAPLRDGRATVVQATSWQNCLGARRYGAHTRQAEGVWHGRIVVYAGVGSIARDAPFVIANFAKRGRIIRIVARARALTLSRHFVSITVF